MLGHLLLVLALPGDTIALVHQDDSKSKLPLFATLHQSKPDVALEYLPPACASYLHFFAGGGKHPVEFVLAADRDGDGNDELVVSRVTVATHGLDLAIVSAPSALSQKKPVILASTPKNGLGFLGGDDRILGIGRIDRDGDGVDELAIVRTGAPDDDHDSIEIRPLPSGKKQPLGAPIASYPDVGSITGGGIVAAFGLPLDEVIGDELVILRRTVDSAIDVEVNLAPLGSQPTLGAVILSLPAALPATSGSDELDELDELIAARAARIGDAVPGMILTFERAGVRRVETRTLSLDAGLSPPVLDANDPSPQSELVVAVALRRVPAGGPGDDSTGDDPWATATKWKVDAFFGEQIVGSYQIDQIYLDGKMQFATDPAHFFDAVVLPGPADSNGVLVTPGVVVLPFHKLAGGGPTGNMATLDFGNGKGWMGFGSMGFGISIPCKPGSTLVIQAFPGSSVKQVDGLILTPLN